MRQFAAYSVDFFALSFAFSISVFCLVQVMNAKWFGAVLILLAAGLLAGCSVGASSNTSSTIFTGSVSSDAPLADGSLNVTDSSTPSKTFTAPFLADGSYSVDTAGGIAPFLFHTRVREGSRTFELFSASAANGGRVNISPLTSLVVANAADQDCAVAACTPATFTGARLNNAAAAVQTQLVPLLTQFGLAIAESLDSKQSNPARTRKWVFFKHVATGGYVYSRDGPLVFAKDTATGNWRMAGNPQVRAGAKAAKDADVYAPPSGASSFGKSLTFLKDSSIYPDGATLVVVSNSSISPPVTLVYTAEDIGAAKITGAAMVEAVRGLSFLPACPRAAGQPGACINVAQVDSYTYSAAFNSPANAIHRDAMNYSSGDGT